MKHPRDQSVYRSIYNKIKLDIESLTYPVGSFLPAERQLSERYGVERGTLRKGLELLAQEGYIQKLPGAGSKVIYLSRNSGAENQISNSIIYVMPDSESERKVQPFHMEVCDCLEKLCMARGYNLTFTKLKYESQDPLWFHFQNIRGIIWVSTIDPRLLESARKLAIPSVVYCNNSPHFPKVNVNDITCGFDATQHLIDRGCRKILHICGVSDCVSTINRREGYRRALLANGLPYLSAYVKAGDWNFAAGYDATLGTLQEGQEFDGVYAANDMMALGAIRAIVDRGLSVPADIKVVGTDGILQSQMSIPALTTTAVSQEDVALACFFCLTNLIEGRPAPQEILLPSRLVIRESSL